MPGRDAASRSGLGMTCEKRLASFRLTIHADRVRSINRRLVRKHEPDLCHSIGKSRFPSRDHWLRTQKRKDIIAWNRLKSHDVLLWKCSPRLANLCRAPRDGLSGSSCSIPSTATYYRSLYDVVGNDFNWRSRRKMSEKELLAIIGDPLDELHVLHVDGVPAGFAELDRRQPNEIELVQFGLTPNFIGQGFGKWFLQAAVDIAWSYRPNRVWVHTCTLDHRAALPNYLKAGIHVVQARDMSAGFRLEDPHAGRHCSAARPPEHQWHPVR